MALTLIHVIFNSLTGRENNNNIMKRRQHIAVYLNHIVIYYMQFKRNFL